MKIVSSVLASVFAIAVSGAALAEPPGPPPARHHPVCLNAGDIDHYSYPDDQTILFHMKGGKVRIWKNDLKQRCAGLKFEAGIALEIRGGSICENMQVVYVLRRWTPCFLGKFTPYEAPPKR